MREFTKPNIPNLIMMVRPKNFGYNEETASSNSFQHKTTDKVAQKAQSEFDKAVQVLRSSGIQVEVFEDQDKVLPDAIFPNNWISHIPTEGIVIYPMLAQNRKAEVRTDIMEWAMDHSGEEQLIDLRNNERILEGTGSIVFDHGSKTAFACMSPRTNLTLLNELCEQIDYSVISFEALDLNGGQIYHTNVVMSIGDKLGIVCLECVPDFIERSMLKKAIEKIGKKVVEISYVQLSQFAGNALEVMDADGELKYIMSTTAYGSLHHDQINTISKSSHVIQIDIPTIEEVGGGSIRCMMAGFFDYPR